MKEYKGFLVDDDLTVYNSKSGKKLTPYVGTDGYMKVRRRIGGRKYQEIRLHRLYAICYMDNPDSCPQVNHKDSNKSNSTIDNLEWCTASYNMKHSYNSGTRFKKNTKLCVETKDHKKIGRYESIQDCCRTLGLDGHKVSRVLKGELREDYLGYLFTFA